MIVGAMTFPSAISSERAAMSATPFEYQKAIEDALPGRTVDQRAELRRCVANWRAYASERKVFADEIAKHLRDDRVLVLEVGNAGFPRYGYVLAGGGVEIRAVKHDTARRRSLKGSALESLLSRLVSSDADMLKGDASAEIEDADCYFLTVKVGSIMKQVAVYGPPKPSSAEGKIIRAIWKTVGGTR